MSSLNNTNTMENLLLQTLMGRLQINPQNPSALSTQSLEDLLLANLSPSSSDADTDSLDGTHLAKEEAKLERDIIRLILSGNVDSLKPNSGQAVSVGDHHICVGFHQDNASSGYRVWEWHGHVMVFDEEDGYTPEYVYGNYFERVRNATGNGNGIRRVEETEEEEEEEKSGNLGLRELIDGGDSNGGRIVHRSVSASTTRF